MRFQPGLGLRVLSAVLILSGCRPTSDLHWERAEAGLPRQAVILALAVDPADPNRLWAGYYAPGGLSASCDGGQTWTTDIQGLSDNPVFDLLVLPGGELWAATRDGLLESTDGGASWRPAAGDLPSAAAFALAADGSGRIYVGLDDSGLYVRETSESPWVPLVARQQVQAGRAGDAGLGLAAAAVLSLAVSPEATQLYAGTAGRGLFASHNAGRTWHVAFPTDYVPNLAFNPSRPALAVASLRDRLVRTGDGGETWEVLPISWARDEVVSLLWRADPKNGEDGALWAGTGQGRIYCSHDRGTSWVEMRAGLPTHGGVLALATDGDRLLAGTWTGIYASPRSIVPSAQAQAGWCEGYGQTWTYLTPLLGTPYAQALLATDGGLLIGTRAGLFRWQSAARRWEPLQARTPKSPQAKQGVTFPPDDVTALAIAPSDRQVVYAGSASSGLYRSGDGGASWAKVPSDLEVGIRALAIAPEDANHVYLLAAWERMYESGDGGRTWQARWTGLDVTTEAISLVIDPLDSRTVYLGADTGLYRSRHGGEDWRPVGRPLDDQTVLTLVTLPAPNVEGDPSVLYIGATGGAYRSYDGGETIEPWGRGLGETSVTAFLFDRELQNVHAGTAYAGLYQSVDGGATWQPHGPHELANEVVEAMAWGSTGELFVASAGGVWVGKY